MSKPMRAAVTMLAILAAIILGDVATSPSAWAEAPGGNQGPVYHGPPQCFEDGHCRMPGDRMLSDAQVQQAIADARAHARGGDSGSTRSGGRGGSGGHADEAPVVIRGVNVEVAPLPSTYVDPSYTHGTATRESVFGTAGAYGGSHP